MKCLAQAAPDCQNPRRRVTRFLADTRRRSCARPETGAAVSHAPWSPQPARAHAADSRRFGAGKGFCRLRCELASGISQQTSRPTGKRGNVVHWPGAPRCTRRTWRSDAERPLACCGLAPRMSFGDYANRWRAVAEPVHALRSRSRVRCYIALVAAALGYAWNTDRGKSPTGRLA